MRQLDHHYHSSVLLTTTALYYSLPQLCITHYHSSVLLPQLCITHYHSSVLLTTTALYYSLPQLCITHYHSSVLLTTTALYYLISTALSVSLLLSPLAADLRGTPGRKFLLLSLLSPVRLDHTAGSCNTQPAVNTLHVRCTAGLDTTRNDRRPTLHSPTTLKTHLFSGLSMLCL